MKELTENEKAAICYHIFGGCKDRTILFTIAEGENRVKNLTPGSLKTTANNWINSHRIQTGINLYKALKLQERENIINEYKSNQETEPGNGKGKIEDFTKTNFLDRDEFLKFLNDRANEINDDKLRNDILKMLSDNLRYKDSDSSDENTQIKAYLPIICQDCEIYKRCKGCNLSQCNK